MHSTLHPSTFEIFICIEWLNKGRRKKTLKNTLESIGENLFQGSEMGGIVQASLSKALHKLKDLGSGFPADLQGWKQRQL